MTTPSAIDADLLARVRLACVPGVGPRLRQLLLERFGSHRGVFAAAAGDIAAIPRIGPKTAAAIVDPALERTAGAVIELCGRRGVAPGILFVRGTIERCDSLAVAIVGARHATAYGRKVAWQLAGGLARAGYTVVSGLARGIDAAAHRGALDAGGRTLAVLGNGVLRVYPPEHADLATEVAARGAVISEALPLAEPTPGCFPQRNRLISGLSLGTVVVEASSRSGALITARTAGEQGREVFAVPGPIDSRMSRGCHDLIRDGARLVQSVDDVLEELGPLFEATASPAGRTIQSPAELQLDDVERRVLDACDAIRADGPVPIDDVVVASGLAASQVIATVGVLEMRRIIRRLPGNQVERR
jgi:DNA processing protein